MSGVVRHKDARHGRGLLKLVLGPSSSHGPLRGLRASVPALPCLPASIHKSRRGVWP